jgi:hypothetical protein
MQMQMQVGHAFRVKFYNKQGYSMKFKVGCRKSNGNYNDKWVNDVTNGLTKYCRFNDGDCDLVHIAVYYYDPWYAWTRIKALNSMTVDENDWAQSQFGYNNCNLGFNLMFIINPKNNNNYLSTYQCIKIKKSYDISNCNRDAFDISHNNEGSDCPAVSDAFVGDHEEDGDEYYEDEDEEDFFERRFLNAIEDPNIHAFFFNIYYSAYLSLVLWLILGAVIFAAGCLCNRCLACVSVLTQTRARKQASWMARYEMVPLSLTSTGTGININTTDIGGGATTTATAD